MTDKGDGEINLSIKKLKNQNDAHWTLLLIRDT